MWTIYKLERKEVAVMLIFSLGFILWVFFDYSFGAFFVGFALNDVIKILERLYKR